MAHEHVAPAVRHLLSEPGEIRCKYIEQNRYVPYQRGLNIVQDLESLMTDFFDSRPASILISGEPSMGKTMIMDDIQRRYPPRRSDETGAVRHDLVRINVPLIVDIRSFLSRILDYLGVPHSSNDRQDALQRTVFAALIDAGTKVLAIDEFHNFLQSTPQKQHDAMTVVRDLANIPLGLVCAGTSSAEACIRSDQQLAERFVVHWLDRWGETNECRDFLATFETRIPLRRESELARADNVQLLIRLSGGLMRALVKIIRDAAVLAIESGEERMTEEFFRVAAATFFSHHPSGQPARA